MSIIERPDFPSYEYNFIFIEKNILIKKGSLASGGFLQAESLPSDKNIAEFIQNGTASDWFAEPSMNYCAMLLPDGCSIPNDFEVITLRQFFWDSKSQSEKENAALSSLGSLASRAMGFLKLRKSYRRCPECGTLLKVHENLVAKVCPSCKRLDFPRIEPAVIVLVKKEDEILLVKSKTTGSSAFYSCVAGFIEHGESAEQCVEREVLEETGLSIKNISYRGSQPWPFPDQLMLAFTAEYKSGEIKIQEEEIEDAGWYKTECLPPVPKPGSIAYNLIFGLL